jgi:hypothetical protein
VGNRAAPAKSTGEIFRATNDVIMPQVVQDKTGFLLRQ